MEGYFSDNNDTHVLSVRGPNPAPNPLDWETIRPIFEDLYVSQGLSLKVVKDILEKEHHFYASERMYKTRIRNWHVDKKNKKDEMLAILRKLKIRDSLGKKSKFYIRGKVIRVEEVYRYFGRKGVKRIDDVDIPTEHVSTPKDVKCLTPSDSPKIVVSFGETLPQNEHLQPHLANSQVLQRNASSGSIPHSVSQHHAEKSMEKLLGGAISYYSHMFAQGTWILGTFESDIPDLYPSMKFGGLFFTYHNLRTLKDSQGAFLALDSAFGMVETLLRVQDPRLLLYLLEVIAYTRFAGYDQLANQFVIFFAAMSRNLLGYKHPITSFAEGLWHGEDKVASKGAVEVGLECMLKQFRDNIGQCHHETMRLLLTGATILKHQGNYWAATRYLDQLVTQYEIIYGQVSYQTCHGLIDKAYIKIILQEYDDAEILILMAMKRAECIENLNENVESRVRCLVCLARLRQDQFQVEQTRNNLELANDIGGMALDDDHWMMRDVKASLDECVI